MIPSSVSTLQNFFGWSAMERIRQIYKEYCEKISKIENLRNTTRLTYDITDDMLSKYSDQELARIRKEFAHNIDRSSSKVSYCPADFKTRNVEKKCEWLQEVEYAEREGLSLEEVISMANDGKLGNLLVVDNIRYIIWPKSMQGKDIANLPELGKKTYEVKYSVSVQVDAVVEDPSIRLALALTNKTTDTMKKFIDFAYPALNEQCFLSCWSAFESFIKEIIYALIELDADAVFGNKKYASRQISYGDIFSKSEEFADIAILKSRIIEEIILDQEKSHESIHSLINLIKECFLKEYSPYDTWYVLDGERKEINYSSLMEVKDARNAIVHDNGKAVGCAKCIEHLVNDGRIVIDDDSYAKYILILRAIASNIVTQVGKKYE